jgi:hypothetical protein
MKLSTYEQLLINSINQVDQLRRPVNRKLVAARYITVPRLIYDQLVVVIKRHGRLN